MTKRSFLSKIFEVFEQNPTLLNDTFMRCFTKISFAVLKKRILSKFKVSECFKNETGLKSKTGEVKNIYSALSQIRDFLAHHEKDAKNSDG